MLEVIVIGSGPAGASCAIYLKRFNHDVIVITKSDATLATAHQVDNYYGHYAISGADLYQKGIEQMNSLGINIVDETVLSIEYYGHFVVTTNKNIYEAKKVVLATGKARNKLKIKNAKNYEQKGLSYCATCDGFFYRNKRIGIIGSGSAMKHELSFLQNMSSDVTVFTDGVNIHLDNVKVVTDKLVELYGTDFVEGIKTEKDSYELDGVFVAIGDASTFDFIKHLGIACDTNNNIIVNKNYETNIPGLYAAGDAIGGILQIVKATYDGMMVAYQIHNEGKRE